MCVTWFQSNERSATWGAYTVLIKTNSVRNLICHLKVSTSHCPFLKHIEILWCIHAIVMLMSITRINDTKMSVNQSWLEKMWFLPEKIDFCCAVIPTDWMIKGPVLALGLGEEKPCIKILTGGTKHIFKNIQTCNRNHMELQSYNLK